MCVAPYRHLVELGCIKPLCDLLTLMDSKIVQVALNGLENILRLGELEAKRGGGINPYCALIEEAYGTCTILNPRIFTFMLIMNRIFIIIHFSSCMSFFRKKKKLLMI